MSVFVGPEIENRGLIFHYDMNNVQKSWRGKPSTNLCLNGSDTLSGDNWFPYCAGNTNNITYNTTDLKAPDGSYTATKLVRDSGTACGGSGAWGLAWGLGNVTPGTVYTISMWACSPSPISNVVFNMNDSGGGGNINLTSTWQRFTFTSALPSSGTGNRGLQFIMPAGSGTAYFWGAQLEENSFMTPYMSTTKNQGSRSTTQAIIDLTNRNTITATSLTYNNDNTFSFNGSTNHIITTNSGLSHGTGNFTYSCWAKFAGLPVYGTIFENGFYTAGILIRFQTNEIRIYAQFSTTSYTNAFSFTPTIGQWYHLVITRVGNNLLFYSNGALLSTIAFGTSISVVPGNNLMYIGMSQHQAGQCFNGQLASAQVYNRALSANEILQNYTAVKYRYGLT